MNTFSIVFLATLFTYLAVSWYLTHRHLRHVNKHHHQVPAAFQSHVSLDVHQKAADYTTTQTRFEQSELIVSTVLLLAWTLGGGLNLLDIAWRDLQLSTLVTGVGVMLSAFIIINLLELPLSTYQTFGIEQRFGFNRTTLKTYLLDLAKELFVFLLVGTPLAALVLWLMEDAGRFWWFYVWLVWMGFSLLMMWAYPVFIAPLFNKFKPLEDRELRQRIEALLQRNGFSSDGVFVIDGSKRSSHGNAYFTGFGNNKRIVFYDTLLKDLTVDEMEAVLAHELGHFKRNHVTKKLVFMMLMSLLGLALLGWLMEQTWFYQGLGVSKPSVHTAMLLFLMIIPVFSFFIQPFSARLSRKYEFEADEFAAKQADAKTLVQALVKLYKENASTLTPDPLYSAFHDSHPPAPVRVSHLLRHGNGRVDEKL